MKIELVDRGLGLNNPTRTLLENRLNAALSRFDSRIRQLTLVVADVNGPKGGDDKQVRLSLEGRASGERVVLTDSDASLVSAVARVADRASRTLARRWQKKSIDSKRGGINPR